MAKIPYTCAIGSLMYAMICIRPDIAHAMGVVSRFMSNLGRKHWEVVFGLYAHTDTHACTRTQNNDFLSILTSIIHFTFFKIKKKQKFLYSLQSSISLFFLNQKKTKVKQYKRIK